MCGSLLPPQAYSAEHALCLQLAFSKPAPHAGWEGVPQMLGEMLAQAEAQLPVLLSAQRTPATPM